MNVQRRVLQAFCAVALFAHCAAARADVLIDDFSEAEFARQESADAAFYESQALSGPPPISLRLCNVVPLMDDPGTIDLDVNGGSLGFSTANVPGGALLALGWYGGLAPGVPPSGNGTLLSSDLQPLAPRLDLSAEDTFLIDYVNGGAGAVSFQIFVYDGALDDLTLDQSPVGSIPVGAGRLQVPFSQVFANVAPDAVGGLGISLIHPGDAGDIRILGFAASRPVFSDGFESGNTSAWSTSTE